MGIARAAIELVAKEGLRLAKSHVHVSAPRHRHFNYRPHRIALHCTVGRLGAQSTLDNALSDIREFGLTRARAVVLVHNIARAVDGWAQHFGAQGVCDADMARLEAAIDRDSLRLQRREYC